MAPTLSKTMPLELRQKNTAKGEKKKLIVTIPAFNEEKTIGNVIKRIPRKVNNHSVEVLVVDDGSKDQTINVAIEAGADHIVKHKYNLGLGKTFKDGIENALALGADIIVNIDADNQFNPAEMEQLTEPLLRGEADMVTGSRFLNESVRNDMPWLRKWGNKRFTRLVNKITNETYTDTQCGFRAYSREAALRLSLNGKFTYTQEVFLDLASKGLKIKEVPITVHYFKERKSALSGKLFTTYGLRALSTIARATRDRQPLAFFGVPALIILALGLLGGLSSFAYWLVHHATTPVRTLFGVSVFFMTSGIALGVLALLADMLLTLKKSQEEIIYRLKKIELGGN